MRPPPPPLGIEVVFFVVGGVEVGRVRDSGAMVQYTLTGRLPFLQACQDPEHVFLFRLFLVSGILKIMKVKAQLQE